MLRSIRITVVASKIPITTNAFFVRPFASCCLLTVTEGLDVVDGLSTDGSCFTTHSGDNLHDYCVLFVDNMPNPEHDGACVNHPSTKMRQPATLCMTQEIKYAMFSYCKKIFFIKLHYTHSKNYVHRPLKRAVRDYKTQL